MAVFDFLTAAFVIPGQILIHLLWQDFPSIPLCRFISWSVAMCVTPGMYLLLIVSWIRYRKVCKATLPQVTVRQAKIMCVVALSIAGFFSILSAIAAGGHRWENQDLNMTGVLCELDDDLKKTPFTFLTFVSMFSVLMVCGNSLIMLYMKIGYEVYKHGVKMKTSLRGKMSSRRNTNVSLGGMARNHSIPSRSSRNMSVTSDSDDVSGAGVRDESDRKPSAVLQQQSSVISDSGICKDEDENPRKRGSGGSRRIRPSLNRMKSLLLGERFGKTTRMLCVISVVYVMAYTPALVIFIYLTVRDTAMWYLDVTLHKYVFRPLYNCMYLGCALNFPIYSLVDDKFRNRCKRLFKCRKR